MRILTGKESKALDSLVIHGYGIISPVLMENAGRSVVELSKPFVDFKTKNTLVISGTGNNGGDGFVVARYIWNMGGTVSCIIAGKEENLSPDAKFELDILRKMEVPFSFVSTMEEVKSAMEGKEVVIDGLIGTGLSSPAIGFKKEIIDFVNHEHPFVIAIDIPSGVMSDTGSVGDGAIRADLTVTFGTVKRGHLLYPGKLYTGKLLYSSIGMPKEALDGNGAPVLLEEEEARKLIPIRKAWAHKGSNGFIGIFAGSEGMEGAALLSGMGALYAGGGRIAIVTPEKARKVMAGKVAELMISSLKEESYFHEEEGKAALKKAEQYDVLALGPGLGRKKETMDFVETMVKHCDKPMVLDADALFAIGEKKIDLAAYDHDFILTPHIGEFSKLTGLSTEEAERNRIDVAKAYAVKHKVTLLLKGAPTVIAAPDGRLYVNDSGNSGMATGGMGDVLTGVIASLLGQGVPPFEAAALGAYLHGLSGDLNLLEKGIGFTAYDVAKQLPKARKKVEEEK